MATGTEPIKAVFFDVDGTLYSHTQNKMPESAKRAIHRLRSQGILCLLAAGRNLEEMASLDLGVELDGQILLNGLLCLDRAGNILIDHSLPADMTSPLAELFQKKKCP